MPAPALPPLAEWETFYVIIGSSAAALTGLMFVVIALGAEARKIDDSIALRAFATPTIVHFCAVLLVAAFLSTPRQTIPSLRACLVVCGLAGLGYVMAWVVVHVRRQKSYAPVLSDWIWHVALPVIGYVSLLACGVVLRRSPETALYLVGASALFLLYVGIHNAWDGAVWLATKGRQA